jgi:type IV pilus assembly protein PilB
MNPHKDLGQVLVELGYVSERDVFAAKAQELGIPFADLERVTVDPDVISLIPERVAKSHKVLPLKREGAILWLATSSPSNLQALDDARMASGLRVQAVLAVPQLIEAQIRIHYEQPGQSVQGIPSGVAEGSPRPRADIQAVLSEAAMGRPVEETEGEGAAGDQAPIIKLANMLIQQAILDRASDIHIEPQNNDLRVRYRIDGVLIDAMHVPKNLQAALVSRLKIMAEMDIAERRLPQDGRIQVRHQGKEYDLRASSVPSAFGEKLVLRVLDKSSVMIGLDKLGLTPENERKIIDIAYQPNGMFLCTGPTGSGKTTTLYSILQLVNKVSVNIVTVEDPVEYQIPGITQVQVNRKAGLNFASALRAFLRQDPDIIMIGEMRDLETAQIGVESALTGHLVLSTLHTNDAPSSVVRLVDMGIEPYLISATVIGVLAQRLGRKLCPDCKQPVDVPQKELERLGFQVTDPQATARIFKARGCEKCRNTGYRGRVGFHELLVVNGEIAELIVSRATLPEIRQAARANGMKELREDGLLKVLEGITDPQEVMRVVYTTGY